MIITGVGNQKFSADYLDYQHDILGLRQGAQITADFMVMLGFAAAIASFGLLQDSAAIIIRYV